MRKILASSLIAAMAPTVAHAADGNQADGYGSFTAGYHSFEIGHYTYETYTNGTLTSEDTSPGGKADGLDMEARITGAVPLGGKFAAQVDAVLGRTNFGCNGCSSLRVNETTVAAHVFKRNPDKSLIGLIAQRTANTSSYGYIGLPTTYYIGGEGQYYADKLTIYSQVAYAIGDEAYYKRDGVHTALQLRYFPRENLMVALKGGYEQTNMHDRVTYQDNKVTVKSWSLGGKAEYRLPSSRVSLTADVDYSDASARSSLRYSTNAQYGWGNYSDVRAMIGVKLNFGTTTLQERDRSGASLDPLRSGMQLGYYGVS